MQAKRIAVVGQGIIGLTSAYTLLEAGYEVHVFFEDDLSKTTSMAAGAYWWPHRVYPTERVAVWAKQTYDRYRIEVEDSLTGVHFEEHYRICVTPDENSFALNLTDSWERLDGHRFGYPESETFRAELPVIDTPTYLPYLKQKVISLGATFVQTEITAFSELAGQFDLVVNCTGVAAGKLAGDPEVYPIRGQAVRLSKPEGLNSSYRLITNDNFLTLVLPRKDDVILGGTSEKGSWDLSPSEETTQAMIERCEKLVPEIKGTKVLGTTVGLRPGRDSVRLELDTSNPGIPIIHNYGHGGAGYTVGWGCAFEVVALALSSLSG